MAGSGRTGAAQHGACKGMEEQSRQGTGRGAGGAGQEEKEKGGAGDQEGLGCLYRGGREFLACASREEFGSDSRWETRDWVCADRTAEKRKRETGRTAGLGRKGFSYFPFYKKKILQIRFEFKFHESKFKSNHKQ